MHPPMEVCDDETVDESESSSLSSCDVLESRKEGIGMWFIELSRFTLSSAYNSSCDVT